MVRGLKDIKVLKSYLFLVWSEWDTPYGFDEMCTSILEDFGGICMVLSRRWYILHYHRSTLLLPLGERLLLEVVEWKREAK